MGVERTGGDIETGQQLARPRRVGTGARAFQSWALGELRAGAGGAAALLGQIRCCRSSASLKTALPDMVFTVTDVFIHG